MRKPLKIIEIEIPEYFRFKLKITWGEKRRNELICLFFTIVLLFHSHLDLTEELEENVYFSIVVN